MASASVPQASAHIAETDQLGCSHMKHRGQYACCSDLMQAQTPAAEGLTPHSRDTTLPQVTSISLRARPTVLDSVMPT